MDAIAPRLVKLLHQRLLIGPRKIPLQETIDPFLEEPFPTRFFMPWVDREKQAIIRHRRFVVARRIADHAATLPHGEWILFGAWDHENWGGELPDRAWIDAVTPHHPVWIYRLDGRPLGELDRWLDQPDDGRDPEAAVRHVVAEPGEICGKKLESNQGSHGSFPVIEWNGETLASHTRLESREFGFPQRRSLSHRGYRRRSCPGDGGSWRAGRP